MNKKSGKKKSKKISQEKEQNKKIGNLLIRYGLLVFISILGFNFFYIIFLKPTTYISYLLLSIFFETKINGSFIIINNIFPIEIIGACVAASAYFLLLVLNLSTPDLSLKKRVYSIILSFGIIFILNVLRIFLLANVYMFDFTLFEILHWFFWYFMSMVFVICTWFSQVKIFDIQEIPFYSDFKYLYSISNLKRE